MSNEEITDMYNTNKFYHKETILLSNVINFYNTKKYLKLFLSYILGTSDISLRVFDWFVANYAKKNRITYRVKSEGEIKNFEVYLEYHAQLDSHTKQYFDPFCRKRKIYYHYQLDDEEQTIITTIGQLNFFKWAIKNKIYLYIAEHLEEIVKDMNNVTKIAKQKHIENIMSDIPKPRQQPKSDEEICLTEVPCTIFDNHTTTPTSSDKRRNKRVELSSSIYKHVNIKTEKTIIL